MMSYVPGCVWPIVPPTIGGSSSSALLTPPRSSDRVVELVRERGIEQIVARHSRCGTGRPRHRSDVVHLRQMTPAHADLEARQSIRQRRQRLPVRNRNAAVLRAVDRAGELLPRRSLQQLHLVGVGEVGEKIEIETARTNRNTPIDLCIDAARAQTAEIEIRRCDCIDAAGRSDCAAASDRTGLPDRTSDCCRRGCSTCSVQCRRDRRDHVGDVDVVVVDRQREIRTSAASNSGRNTTPKVIVSASSGVRSVLPLLITPIATVVY